MPKSILITGCSSGIGKELCLGLDRLGYQVFAGVRGKNDAEMLSSQASPSMTPVLLDITDLGMVAAATSEVQEKTGGKLFCLVNNAGINLSGAMEFIPLADFRLQMEVNLVGQLALTQACMPMIRQGSGRLIFISSTAGRLVGAFNGPYSISKAGVIAMSDALRLELSPWQIPVSVLIVGSVQTPIWEKSMRKAGELLRSMPQDARKLYGSMQINAGKYYSRAGKTGMQVENITRIIIHLLEVQHPKSYVLVGWDAVLFELISKLLPVRLRDWLICKWMGLGQSIDSTGL